MTKKKLNTIAKEILAKKKGVKLRIYTTTHTTSNVDGIIFMTLYRSKLLGNIWSNINICIKGTIVTGYAIVRVEKFYVDTDDIKEYRIALNRATGLAAEIVDEIAKKLRGE